LVDDDALLLCSDAERVGPRSGLLSFWVNTPAGRIDAALAGWVDDPCAAGCF